VNALVFVECMIWHSFLKARVQVGLTYQASIVQKSRKRLALEHCLHDASVSLKMFMYSFY
jgi:hypothetical protein